MNSNRKVLVIYTGGTIGMIKDASTGILAPFNFKQLQKQIPEINQLSTQVDTISFDEPLDSSNMNLNHWRQLAEMVRDNYDSYHGFVILHGTDTMAYTAAALSFMFENLAKPVILTGSQLPIGMVRTDGKENFITAIEIAGAHKDGVAIVPEVCIYFENELYRGNRTYKANTEHFEAFQSPNFPPLAEAGIHIKYNLDLIRSIPSQSFKIDTRMDNHVAVLSLFPGISEHIIKAALTIPHNKLLILRTYGSGNAMTDKWFIDALKEAIANGLLIVNVSQCQGGGVMQGRYETSSELAKMGVISGGDMQLEAALTKSMHLIGKGLTGETFKKEFVKDLRGEVSVNTKLSKNA